MVNIDSLNTASVSPTADSVDSITHVYKITLKEDIMPAAWRLVSRGFADAFKQNADIVLIHLNTYGGMVNVADSIRTCIINSPLPVWAFIDNQAASAGALISIACDRIYMRKGASIGAATVVDQSGDVVPDKYQSFMRGMMRSTAEAHGKDTLVQGSDTIFRWRRDPRIAEAMVDPTIQIKGIIDSGKVLTFTADEAIQHRFCEGMAESIDEVMRAAGIEHFTLTDYRPTVLDRIIGFLTNPTVSGILIMLMIGGIYFELQTPGVGFPLAAAAVAALLYFAPHYIEGLTEYWELLIFFVGVLLLLVEVFALPGFGVAGVSGIILMVAGLTLAMVDNQLFRNIEGAFRWTLVLKPFTIVLVSLFFGLLVAMFLGKKFFTTSLLPNISMGTNLDERSGYIAVDTSIKSMNGRTGLAISVLRPAGKVQIDGEVYDAVASHGFIEKGETVRVVDSSAGQLYVTRV